MAGPSSPINPPTSRIDNPAGNILDGFKITAHRWFPVSPPVLHRIGERVKSKHYQHYPQDLIHDVRSDASLYLYCVRKLRRIIRAGESRTGSEELFNSIESIVTDLNFKQVHHTADRSQPFQLERQREIVLSSTVVELLSEKLELDSDAGFVCALLRQLGYALIAWNYPAIYRQALDEVASQVAAGRTDINTVLHANLGFSPSMLGLRFAEAWGLPPELTAEINPKSQFESVTQREKGSLAELCEIGEAFARANNPHLYPNPRGDWDRAMNVIGRHLGPNGIVLIQDRAASIFGDSIKKIIPAPELRAGAGGSSGLGEDRFNNNLFVKPLPAPLQEQIKNLYLKLEPGKVNPDLIRLLLQEITDRLGFGAAVVYTLDPAESTLNPVFRKGKPRFTSLRPFETAARLNDTDPIRRAFSSDQVICEAGHLPNGATRLLVAMPIRGKSKVGVLYLEQAEADSAEDRIDLMLGAKFIAACLKDLLLLT